jgi:predicted porin
MMMKKTTSALAVAALLGTGAASAATFQVNDDSSLTVGGDFQFAYGDENDKAGDGSTTFRDNGSSLVFAGEQAHDSGLTTSFYLDFDEFGSLEGGTDNTLTTDEYHVSFAGDFGEIKVGAEGDVTGPVFDVGDVEEFGGIYLSGGDSNRVVQYYSTDLNGISYAVQAQINGDAQQSGSNQSSTSFAGIVQADLGSFMIAAGYDQRANGADEPLAGVMASTSIAGVSLSANYVQDDAVGTESDRTALSANYNYGGGSVYGVLNSVSFDDAPTRDELGLEDGSSTVQAGTDFTQTILGINYNILPNAYVYGEMGTFDYDNDENDYVATGMYYSW